MPISPPLPRPSAFTGVYPGRINTIVVDIRLSIPFHPDSPPSPKPPLVEAKALWDTGATNCAITQSKAAAIGLPIIGKAEVGHADGKSIQNVYLLNLYLPNKVFIPLIRATECKSAEGNFDFIVGMDIITLGDFSITNVGGRTTFSFRTPSLKTIDYVKDVQALDAQLANKVGRNELCPCGSGKKFKKCHGA